MVENKDSAGATRFWRVASFIGACVAGQGICAVTELPSPPAFSPEEQLALFELAEDGYRVELVASDPLVQDPVAMAFDGQGRLWVVEMRGFMQNLELESVDDPIGRISVLWDADGDGVMDESRVFLDNLVLPRAISIQPDGVLVAESEPLWFVQDIDGDLIADRRTLVDPNYAQNNVEHSANGLLRGLDNWVYNAKEGHRYRRAADGWIRQATERRGQWGISQDDWGRLFYNYNHSQLHGDLVPPNTLTRNPSHQPVIGLGDAVVANNRIYPIRPTPAANRAYIPGVLDDDRRIKKFTSACAPFIYRGDLMPEFAGDAFVCATVGNLVTRNAISVDGFAMSGSPVYPDRDFLASSDERFRPCWIASGPDGALYIADMYRGVVQDGIYMSPYLREHSRKREMDQPIHRGRIWRIVPDGYEQPPAPDFAGMDADALLAALSHANGWWRDTAQLHLVERGMEEALPGLVRMALESGGDVRARLHALWSLEGLGYRDAERLFPLLEDDSPAMQSHALRVLLNLVPESGHWQPRIDSLPDRKLADEAALQWILVLGALPIDDRRRLSALSTLSMPRSDSPLIRDALLSSLSGMEIDFLESIAKDRDNEEGPGPGFLIETLATAITRSRDPKSAQRLLSLHSVAEGWISAAIWSGIDAFGSALQQKPIVLDHVPEGAKDVPRLGDYFAWPGHEGRRPGVEKPARAMTAAEEGLFIQGRQVYLASCLACHGPDGKGLPMLGPPLADSDWVQGDPGALVRVLLHGLAGPITVSGKAYGSAGSLPAMPPMAILSNDQIAAALTYVRRSWGNDADPVAPRAVSTLRIQTQGRMLPWTQDELLNLPALPSL